ncbi:MAG: nuoL [Gammaproteobacteria bacterium]|jgi:NADH-quinone oxidoreductase subunit L|nr:nuoL [Gammaproteobacteria bacterium]
MIVHHIQTASLICILSPLLGAAISGLAGKRIGNRASHTVAIVGLAISFAAAIYLFAQVVLYKVPVYNADLYLWGGSGRFSFHAGILVDSLTTVMVTTVTFVSLLVHVYSIGYMRGDPAYHRFFSYMSLFTFFMLVLVMGNNFLMLFFGWEGVGLVSYLLIGFWFERESAARGSMKAFIVNRVGDFGFILGIAVVLAYFGTLDYAQVFKQAPSLAGEIVDISGTQFSVITVMALLLFVGAMGKSAQIPLHVWLPESMEGPTPISALIHAATMVTAGVYMVARLSPLFEFSEVALSVVLVFGATGALFLGMLALVENDIKRVIAYSTMSQLGYMMAANGVSAFSAAIFHLMTHACFKALLFLAAGSVIVALHHQQDMRKMGGLRKYLPITYITFLIGALALAALPPFAGFYSKDAIIEVVKQANTPGATYAYYCLLIGAFVTSLYIFRAFFMTFHGEERMVDDQNEHKHGHGEIHESEYFILLPLVLLAIPSIFLGFMMVTPMLYSGQFSLLGSSIYVAPEFDFMTALVTHYDGPAYMALTAFMHPPFWLSVLGILMAWCFYVKYPYWATYTRKYMEIFYCVLKNKYGFDAFNDFFFVRGVRGISQFFYRIGDVKIIDDCMVNGTGRAISHMSAWVRKLQSGYLYHYVFVMILGLFAFLAWVLL